MAELTTGKQYTDVVHFCPACGSPSLEMDDSLLVAVDSACSCKACSWEGKRSDLIATPIIHEFASSEETIKAMMGDLRTLLARNFVETFGRFLVKWGFLDRPINVQQLGRYTVAVATSVIQAVLEERQRSEKEKIDNERPE